MLTSRRIIKLLSAFCIICFFCPLFLVSCSGTGETIEVSGWAAVKGYNAYMELYVEPQPGLLICIVLPAAVIVMLFIRKRIADRWAALASMAAAAIDMFILFIFRGAARHYAEINYSVFRTTGWFVFNIMALVIMMALGGLALADILGLDEDLVGRITGGKPILEKEETDNSQTGQASEKDQK